MREARSGASHFVPAPPLAAGIVTGLVLCFAACGGQNPVEPAGPVTQLVKGSGDGQSWYFGNPLPAPYEVVALDASGRRVRDVEVMWAVSSGGGTIHPAMSSTGPDGVATATHTLGPSETSQSVTASASGLLEVEFSASAATPPESAAVRVGDNFFSPRDVVVRVNGMVTWTWTGLFDHNVVFVGAPPERPADSPTRAGGTHEVTFSSAASYPYVCTLHSGMTGTIRVVN